MTEDVLFSEESSKAPAGLSNKAAKFSLHVGSAAIILTVLISIFVKGHLALVCELALICVFFFSVPKSVLSKGEAIKALSLIVPMCVGIYLSTLFITIKFFFFL